MQAALHFQLSSTRTKNIPLGVLLTLANHRSFFFFSPFAFSLLLKDPPELHSAELLTFCSTFVSVPFVSVTEREREQKSLDRKNVKACCLCAGGGWGWEGALEKGQGVKKWWMRAGGGIGGLGQGRGGQRGLPQK